MRLKRRLQVLLLFLAGLPMLVLLFESYRSGRRALLAQIRTDSKHLAQLQVSDLEAFLGVQRQGAEGLVRALESLPELKPNLIQLLLARTLEETPDAYGMAVALEPSSTPLERYAPFHFRDGGTLRYRDLTHPLHAYDQKPWFAAPFASGRKLWSPPYLDQTGRVPMITYSVPLRRVGRVVGVVTVDISLEGVAQELRQLQPGGDGAVYLVNREGVIAAHPSLKVLETGTGEDPGVRLGKVAELLARAGGEAVAGVDPITQRESWLVEEPLPSMSAGRGGQDWSLIVSWPLDRRLRPLRDLALRMGVAFLFLGGGALFFLNRAFEDVISRPLKRLTRRAKALQDGAPEAVTDDEGEPVELRELHQVLHAMAQARTRTGREDGT